ncbi:MAG: hypothetical protein ACRD03_00355 [Acidimicrobiales bacterium]
MWTVPLHLKRIEGRVTDEIDELVIKVADTHSVVRCPACGHKTKRLRAFKWGA